MNEIFAEFMNALIPILFSLVLAIVGAAASFAGFKANQFFNDKTKRSIVESAVLMVEQVGKALGSEEKFARAKELVIIALNERGIKISDVEVQLLIESAVQSFFAHYDPSQTEEK